MIRIAYIFLFYLATHGKWIFGNPKDGFADKVEIQP
jgi:hypothetical protein